ncbi:MAG: GTP-binding protein [Oscillospiraceae bacterium]
MPEQQKKTPCGIGVLAHVDAGKTTISEAMLYEAGARRTLGRVDHQDAFLDTHALERARGITIFSKQALLETEHRAVTLVDTPGHVDFSAEAERIMPVLDCAVLVISGTDGVQAHTLTLWRLLERYQVPTFLFLNKMDLPGMGKEKLLAELRQQLSPACGFYRAAGGDRGKRCHVRRGAAGKLSGNRRRHGRESPGADRRTEAVPMLLRFRAETGRRGDAAGYSGQIRPGNGLSRRIRRKSL